MAALSEITLLRLVAQRLAGSRADSAAGAVAHLTAVQAQHHPGALTSVALRTTKGTRRAVEVALDAGEVVKSWPMRGTLHLVTAADLPWMLEVLAPRVLARNARRRAQLGLDEPALGRARDLAVEALRGGGRMRREELLAVWDAGGLEPAGGRGYHMLVHLSMTGTLCFGPSAAGEQQIVLLEEWIPAPRRPEREEALRELAERYFRGHGPATVRDFLRWTDLPAADARAGVALARSGLDTVEADGTEYLMDPETPRLLDAHRDEARGVFLLPGFDEFVLGYADRSAMLAPEFAQRIVPGGNGVFRPTVVAGGRIIGTWKHAGRGAQRRAEATPFEEFDAETAEAIPELYAALPG